MNLKFLTNFKKSLEETVILQKTLIIRMFLDMAV